MALKQTKSETILDKLASGASFDELKAKHGFTRRDLLTAALFGVSELQTEYIEMLKTHGKFTELHGIK